MPKALKAIMPALAAVAAGAVVAVSMVTLGFGGSLIVGACLLAGGSIAAAIGNSIKNNKQQKAQLEFAFGKETIEKLEKEINDEKKAEKEAEKEETKSDEKEAETPAARSAADEYGKEIADEEAKKRVDDAERLLAEGPKTPALEAAKTRTKTADEEHSAGV